MKIGGFPVLIVISGEETYDWSSNRISGLDVAAEGVVVVTIQYRTNVFGWLSLDNKLAPGNLGLRDQIMAFAWIAENIRHFGGDIGNATLLGHGQMGAFCSFYHLLSPKTKRNDVECLALNTFSNFSVSLCCRRNLFACDSDLRLDVPAIPNEP